MQSFSIFLHLHMRGGEYLLFSPCSILQMRPKPYAPRRIQDVAITPPRPATISTPIHCPDNPRTSLRPA